VKFGSTFHQFVSFEIDSDMNICERLVVRLDRGFQFRVDILQVLIALQYSFGNSSWINEHLSRCKALARDLPKIPIIVALCRICTATYSIQAVRTSRERSLRASRFLISSGIEDATSRSPICWQRYSNVSIISFFCPISLSAIYF
jgi:hypothetical protein